jgi:hypothetical protein
MKKGMIFGLLLVGALAVAQSVTYKLSINGKAYSSPAIVVKGETYVPLKALKSAGVKASVVGGNLQLTLPKASQVEGGANQVVALEACVGEWLFNGIWRVRVTDPQDFTGDRNGRSYRFEFRNGTKLSGFAPSGTGMDGILMALENGTTVSAENVNEVSDPPYLAGGSHSQTINFYWEDANLKPQKIVVLFNPKNMSTSFDVKFNVPDPNLRFKTDCTK